MADIQMCAGVVKGGWVCAIRDKCYRHTAPQSELQAWDLPAFDFDQEEGCNNYIPNVNRIAPRRGEE
jgi:hypothetical protein